MAKQTGEPFIEVTIDDLTFYKMNGKYYVRMKSSLTGERFWKAKAFERSRESCRRFSKGNKLASKLYGMIEEEKRVYKVFCFLKQKAIRLLKENKSLQKTEELLIDYLVEFGYLKRNEKEIQNPVAIRSLKLFVSGPKANEWLLFLLKIRSNFNWMDRLF